MISKLFSDDFNRLMGYLFPVILLLVIIVFIFSPSNNCSHEKEINKLEFNGFVENKFLDERNHFTKTIMVSNLKTKKEYFFENEKSNFYNYVEVGDYIKKPTMSLTITINKNGKDSIFNIIMIVSKHNALDGSCDPFDYDPI